MVFDSSNPSGADFDLGTPNEEFGGPGMTFSGEFESSNDTPLGNTLIISEDLGSSDPDDEGDRGTKFNFDFTLWDQLRSNL